MGHHPIFSVLDVKKSKVTQKLNKRKTASVCILNFTFMAFLKQRLICLLHTWFNFVFGSFFEQNHLLNLIRCLCLGVKEAIRVWFSTSVKMGSAQQRRVLKEKRAFIYLCFLHFRWFGRLISLQLQILLFC